MRTETSNFSESTSKKTRTTTTTKKKNTAEDGSWCRRGAHYSVRARVQYFFRENFREFGTQKTSHFQNLNELHLLSREDATPAILLDFALFSDDDNVFLFCRSNVQRSRSRGEFFIVVFDAETKSILSIVVVVVDYAFARKFFFFFFCCCSRKLLRVREFFL